MTVGVSTVPTGVERLVGPDELFYSTTDRRGLIRTGNSVFLRVSQYSLDELVGSPHNVVRHPEMPAGAYRLMWDRLRAGRATGGYLRNLARDGSQYWVFATLLPLGEGFLSVRMAPRSPLFEPVKQLYAQVTAAEQEAARNGVSRREAAGIGAERIEELLALVGFSSYDDFLFEALPAEVAARGRLVAVAYSRPEAQGPISGLLAAAGDLEGLLGGLSGQLDGYQMLCDRLVQSSSSVLDVALRLDPAVTAAQYASRTVTDTVPVLLNVANVMALPMHTAVTALERMAPRLGRLRTDVADLRFQVALASLHNDMIAAFAAELVDGGLPASSLHQVPLLCDAVQEGVIEMSRTAQVVNQQLREVSALVTEALLRLDEFRKFLGQWRILVLRHRAGGVLGDLLRPIDDELAASQDGMELLRSLGAQVAALAVQVDDAALDAQVARTRTATSAV